MALTVVSKPSGFQPVGGGSLIYQMTEASIAGKPNYRVQFQFNGYTSTLPIFEFRLDATLTLNADIAPILRSLLKMSETTSLRFLNTYVKYQAVWDGGSDAQVNLSGDVIYFYIGNNNILNRRSRFQITAADINLLTGPVLLSPSRNGYPVLNVWPARTAYIEYLHENMTPYTSTLGKIHFSGKKYGSYEMATFREDSFDWDTTLTELVSEPFVNRGYESGTIINTVAKTTINESDFSFTNIGGFNAIYAQTFQYGLQSGIFFRLLKVGAPTRKLTVSIYNTTGGSAGTPTTVIAQKKIDLTYLSSVTPEWVFCDLSSLGLSGATWYAIVFSGDPADGFADITNYYQLYRSAASVYASGNAFSWGGASWSSLGVDFASYLVTWYTVSFFWIDEHEEQKNPVYLKWLNELGGLATWLFDFNQLYYIDPKTYGRYPTLDLFAQGLSFSAWLMIAELARNGVEYGDNLKSGQYVVDFTNESNPLPVFIQPKQLSTTTRRIQSQIQLTARYQQAPNTMM